MQQWDKLFVEFGFEQGGLLFSVKAYIYIDSARNLQLDWIKRRFKKCRFEPGKRIKETGSPDSLTIWFPGDNELNDHTAAISELNIYLEKIGWEKSAENRFFPNQGEFTYRRAKTPSHNQPLPQSSTKLFEELIKKWEADARRAKERAENKEASMSPEWLQGSAYGYDMAATELKELLQKLGLYNEFPF